MTYTLRSFNSETDRPAVLALKQLCTTPQNLYDRATTSDLRRLLAPPMVPLTATNEPSWKEAF